MSPYRVPTRPQARSKPAHVCGPSCQLTDQAAGGCPLQPLRCSGCSGYHGTDIVCPNRPEDDGSWMTESDGPIPYYDEC